MESKEQMFENLHLSVPFLTQIAVRGRAIPPTLVFLILSFAF